jgi:membrane protease YdiL (CAAX protease family)
MSLTESAAHSKSALLAGAWGLTLLLSDLPDIIFKALTGRIPAWMSWGKIGAAVAAVVLCLAWRKIRPLLAYALVMLVFNLALAGSSALDQAAWWRARFGGDQASFAVGYIGVYLRDFGVAAAVILVLWALKRKRSEFYLVKGDWRAPIERVRWLGIPDGESWRKFGWIFAGVAGLAVALPVFLPMRLPAGALLKAAPLLPWALVFAAVNAFNEEVYFRASLLSTLPKIIGKSQILLINAVFFGLAHYLYGSPPGIIGFAMTAFLAWLMGKAMMETRGLLWPWVIHVVPDAVIFAAYALAFAGR